MMPSLIIAMLLCSMEDAALKEVAIPSSKVRITDSEVILQTEEGISLLELAKAASAVTEVVYSYRQPDLANTKFDFSGTLSVRKEHFSSLFRSILRELEFVAVRIGVEGRGVFYSIRRVAPGTKPGYLKSMARVIRPEELKSEAEFGDLVTTSFQINHINSREAATVLTPYFADQFVESIRNIDYGNTLLCTGYASTLVGVARLLEAIDRPPSAPPKEVSELKKQVASLQARIKALTNDAKEGNP